jgi:hypothetical protein
MAVDIRLQIDLSGGTVLAVSFDDRLVPPHGVGVAI